MSSVFVCVESGKVHLCTKRCLQALEETECGIRMCGVTGISYGQEEVALYGQCGRSRMFRLYKDPYEKHRDVSKTLSGVSNFESALRCQAINTMRLLIFSRKRMYAERRKRLIQQAAVRKKISSFAKRCRGDAHPVVFTHLVCIALDAKRRQRAWTPPSAEHQTAREKACADVCVRVWASLVKHTALCKRAHFSRTLPTLVAALLYLMKGGVPMNNIQIIPKNYFLEAALPEANTLHFYGIQRGHFTAVKNELQRAIRQAIEDGLNPHVLAVR
jgi:hypothetical protein